MPHVVPMIRAAHLLPVVVVVVIVVVIFTRLDTN